MKKSFKRFAAMLLCVAMLLSVLPISVYSDELSSGEDTAADSSERSGECGESLTWELTADGTLTISGSGGMVAYANATETPWYGYRSEVKTVVIGANVTGISAGAFADCPNLTGIQVDEANAYYASDESGVLFNKNMTTLIQAPGAIATSYSVPSTVTEIAYSGF